MPKIIIESCNRTPNYDALIAITKCMKLNYQNRTPGKARVVFVEETCRKIEVIEGQLDGTEKSFFDCMFMVNLIDT